MTTNAHPESIELTREQVRGMLLPLAKASIEFAATLEQLRSVYAPLPDRVNLAARVAFMAVAATFRRVRTALTAPPPGIAPGQPYHSRGGPDFPHAVFTAQSSLVESIFGLIKAAGFREVPRVDAPTPGSSRLLVATDLAGEVVVVCESPDVLASVPAKTLKRIDDQAELIVFWCEGKADCAKTLPAGEPQEQAATKEVRYPNYTEAQDGVAEAADRIALAVETKLASASPPTGPIKPEVIKTNKRGRKLGTYKTDAALDKQTDSVWRKGYKKKQWHTFKEYAAKMPDSLKQKIVKALGRGGEENIAGYIEEAKHRERTRRNRQKKGGGAQIASGPSEFCSP